MWELLGSRTFTTNDQIDFARFSGDFNPIHLNPTIARRTITGNCIVHGVNCLMWALDILYSKKNVTVITLDAKFQKSVFLYEEINCFWNNTSKQIKIKSGSILLCSIKVKEGTVLPKNQLMLPVKPALNKSSQISFGEAISISETDLCFRGIEKMANKLYLYLSKKNGVAAACELAMVSEIIGMHVPGYNSLLYSLHADFTYTTSNSIFKIDQYDRRFETLSLSFKTSSFKCIANVAFRPTLTKEYSVDDLSQYVEKDEFKNIKGLIIGGSRGLGEITAKIIASGGGESVITYHTGIDDATKVRDEIIDHGGKCKIMQYNVCSDEDKIRNINDINHLYYFATPKIFSKRSSNYDDELYIKFKKVYVEGFDKVCKSLMYNNSCISVFYPSSIAIDQQVDNLDEYVKAKLDGETFCEELNQLDKFCVQYPRLPRIETDQTLSFIKVNSEDPVKVLLPYIRKMVKEKKHN